MVAALTESMNDRYQTRISGGGGGISYPGALLYTAASLAGMYTARTHRFGLTVLIPLLVVSIEGITGPAAPGSALWEAFFHRLLSRLSSPPRRAC